MKNTIKYYTSRAWKRLQAYIHSLHWVYVHKLQNDVDRRARSKKLVNYAKNYTNQGMRFKNV